MRRIGLAFTVMLLAPGVAGAQTARSTANPVSRAVKAQWDAAKKNLVESADEMPEANFSFKPVDSVRSFGAILAHVAGANYVFCSAALGEKPPHAEDEFEKSATTKAAITRALHDSIEAAHFFELPAAIPAAPQVADQFHYHVAIEDKGKRHTVDVGEASASPALQEVLQQLTQLARAARGG